MPDSAVRFLTALAAALLPLQASRAQAEAPRRIGAAPAAVEEIEVTGERPGPGLWKVSNGGHVLWVLGTLAPLPKKMNWRSRELESVLSQSTEVLPARAAFGFGWTPIGALRLYWQWRHIQSIPDHATLKEVLPAALYARFELLRIKYAPRDTHIETLRPMLAALQLFDKALDASGLTFHNDIQDAVLKIANQHGVALRKIKLKVDDPRGLLKEVGAIPLDAEIGCLATTVARLETDLGAMQARAHAWADGDVEKLRGLPVPEQQAVCLAALSSSARFKELSERGDRAWTEAAENAIAHNQTTLALKPIYELLRPAGTLDQLKAKGYLIESP